MTTLLNRAVGSSVGLSVGPFVGPSIDWSIILLIYCDFDHFCGKVVWGGLLGVKRVTLFFPRVCCCLDEGGNRLIE